MAHRNITPLWLVSTSLGVTQMYRRREVWAAVSSMRVDGSSGAQGVWLISRSNRALEGREGCAHAIFVNGVNTHDVQWPSDIRLK